MVKWALYRHSKQTQTDTPARSTADWMRAASSAVRGDGLLDDEVLAGLRRGHGLVGVEGMGRADIDHVDTGIGEHRLIVDEGPERRAEPGGQLAVVMGTAGADGGDVGAGHGLEGVDMRPGHPAEADDAHVEVTHDWPPDRCRAVRLGMPALAVGFQPGEGRSARRRRDIRSSPLRVSGRIVGAAVLDDGGQEPVLHGRSRGEQHADGGLQSRNQYKGFTRAM